jgi:hypothetical protein
MTFVRLAVVVSLLALAASGAWTSHGSASSTKSCGVQAGPAYTVSGVKGTKYVVGATGGADCAFATKWMRKLATKKIGKLPTTIAGPSGWKCTGFQVAPGWPLKAYLGRCQKGGMGFSWSPQSMSSGA